ncbi:MAG: 30S ribosomal protein S12 methylthiotransferase RimO [Endomicrobium sp.]|jgi:ribosomal protein S12 methylthiotransferase|nr:30S ribosomal protein S12 methylthiotransferase RimO [Endomicrobium sp.]
MRKAIAVVALGCSKNTVEAEYLLGNLQNKGFFISGNVQEADIVIIHTCSFIQDAREESEKYINDVLRLKDKKDVKVYVSGCLPQLLKEEIMERFPSIDGYVGTGTLDRLPILILNGKPVNQAAAGGFNDSNYRSLSSSLPSAYLKIAEGCNHGCSFCIIPNLRGKYTSRTIESLYSETRSLVSTGIRELILTAQDTTSYGSDIYNAFALDKLLSKIANIKGLRWIRLMYAYPSAITDSLLDVFKEYKNICSYMDIPIQHISKNILYSMRRPLNTGKIIEKIKNKLPDMVLRTSIIAGFPGETEADIRELIDFIRQGYFQYVGVFEYSDEKDAPSSKFKNHISSATTKKRRIEIEKVQYEVFKSKMEFLKNSETEFFAENCVIKGKKYLIGGRCIFQSPEVDGTTLIMSDKVFDVGKFYKIVIKDNDGYNIKAEIRSPVMLQKR